MANCRWVSILTPDTLGPDSGAPDSRAPNPGARDPAGPDTGARDPASPRSGAPGTGTPDSGAPGAADPDPGTGGPEPANPGSAAEPTGSAADSPVGLGTAEEPGITGTVNLTMPFSAWAGLSEGPGEVLGYGPADASTCRDLAAQPATRWCLTLPDRDGHAIAHACARDSPGPGPPDARLAAGWLGTLRPVRLEAGDCTRQRETPGYRPPRSLRHLIEIRQRTCTHPGCRRPATRCDEDHTIAYDQGGRTCECNLAPLCER